MSGCPAWEEGICLALSRFTILHLCFSRPQSKLLSGEEIDRERANRLRDAVRSQPGLGPVVSGAQGFLPGDLEIATFSSVLEGTRFR